MTEFDYATLEHRLRELAFLNSGVRIHLSDHRGAEVKEKEMVYEGGLEAFVNYLDRSKTNLLEAPIFVTSKKTASGSRWPCGGMTAITRRFCASPTIFHSVTTAFLAGFRGALTRTVNGYANESGIAKKEKVTLSGDDCREGLTAVLSVKVPDPKFSSQTKDKLVSSEVRPVVESVVNDLLNTWFEEHPAEAKNIVAKVAEAAMAGRRRAKPAN